MKKAILFFMLFSSINTYADNYGYQKGQKIRDLSSRSDFKNDYVEGGRFSNRVYLKQSPNYDVDFDRSVEEGDIVECLSGEKNLSTVETDGFRVLHRVFGKYDAANISDKVVRGDISKSIKFDSTSVKYGNQQLNQTGDAMSKITADIVNVYRNNGYSRRFCKQADLEKDGVETGVSKTFCNAGMTTGIYEGKELDKVGLLPRCGLVLDKDIKIGEIRYLQQINHPDRYRVGYANVSLAQGAVMCKLVQGNPTLYLFDGESRKCEMLVNLQE